MSQALATALWVAQAATSGPTTSPHQAHPAAQSLVLVTVIGMLCVLAGLIVWVLHWGRRLRQQDGWRADADQATTDPWSEAAQRIRPADEPEDRQERP